MTFYQWVIIATRRPSEWIITFWWRVEDILVTSYWQVMCGAGHSLAASGSLARNSSHPSAQQEEGGLAPLCQVGYSRWITSNPASLNIDLTINTRNVFISVMSETGFCYRDWDYWKLSLEIETGIETFRNTVLISRLVLRLSGFQS